MCFLDLRGFYFFVIFLFMRAWTTFLFFSSFFCKIDCFKKYFFTFDGSFSNSTFSTLTFPFPNTIHLPVLLFIYDTVFAFELLVFSSRDDIILVKTLIPVFCLYPQIFLRYFMTMFIRCPWIFKQFYFQIPSKQRPGEIQKSKGAQCLKTVVSFIFPKFQQVFTT